MDVICALLLLAAGGYAFEITDEEYGRFPRLYHLDDYSSCLAKTDGLYCVGSFLIQPPRQHDPTYDLIKEYSADPFHFNRTLVHRGYCVSERCPSSERNSSLRFEQCAAHWGRSRKLRLALTSLKYCKTHAQEYARRRSPEPYDLSQKVMLFVTALLLFCNVIGTLYDSYSGDEGKTRELLTVWSLRSNWRRLTANYEGGDPRLNALSPVQGIRVFLMMLIIGTHTGCMHDMLFVHNPRFVETVARQPLTMMFLNGTSVVMVFVVVSSFLLSYNLLLLSKTHPLRMNMLPLCILKRVARISPVYMLVVGFAATFWPHVRDGPMWPLLVEAESSVCRQKFWAQALYLNNLVQADDHCLVQTWFLATDMQLYILAAVLTIYLSNKRLAALPILSALTVASCLLNGGLAYIFNWKSIMYIAYPETMHTMYHGVESFYRLYITPWGSLPACMVGLLLAHLHFQLHERNIQPNDYRLFRWMYTIAIPSIVAWIVSGNWTREVTDPLFTAAYIALERPVLSLLAAVMMLGVFTGATGWVKNWFAWSGFHAMGRMSLSVLMIHWLIVSCIAASRPQPISTSLLDVTSDSLATACMSYIAAIPLTLMVEMPILRFVNTLVFKPMEQGFKEKKSS